MTKKIYLHMGAHKTGTTTLQSDFANNRDTLRSAGLVYPAYEKADAHLQWAHFLASDMPSSKARLHAQVTEQWLSDLKENEALLLSAESFYRHINDRSDYLPKLRAVLNGAELIPVLCLRNQGEYAKSLYSEWVSNWQYPHNIYKFIQDFYKWFDYGNFVAQISQLGKPILLSYHQIAGDDLSSNFVKQLGYSVELVTDRRYLRPSPSDAEVYLKVSLNKLYPETKHREFIKEAIKGVISDKYPELKAPMPSLIWQGALDGGTFERSYRLANLNLCQQFGKDEATFFPRKIYPSTENIGADILLKLDEAHKLILQKLGNV